jgi:subtilase family serine protease
MMAHWRTISFHAVASLLFFSIATMAQDAAPAARIAGPIDESQRVTLKGTVHPLATSANDRGAAPESMQLKRMHLVLKRSASQDASLGQLIGDQHTPGTVSYHKWLTPDEFGKRFGPSDEDIATVQTWLSGHGFNVAKVNPGRQTIEFSGSVAQLRSAFHTQIHTYQVNGETHTANATDPEIPAALASVVGGFVSLNNFRVKSHARVLGKAAYDRGTDRATPKWTWGNDSVGYDFVLAPQDYAVQYDLTPLYTAGVNGSGQTIAIVNESNIDIEEVNAFRSMFGLSVNPPQVIIDGNDPGVDGINNPDGANDASVEAYLDVEWAGAVAPGATIDLVIAADTELESGLIMAAEHAVYGNVAPIVSLSFGSCEASLGSENQFFSALWEQAAAQGITVIVSAGDSGSAGCDDDNTQYYAVYGQAVNGFASTPYNVGVGGTDFYYSNYANMSSLADFAPYWNTTPTQTPAASLKGVMAEQPWNSSQYGLNIYNLLAQSDGLESTIVAGSGGASNSAVCSTGVYNSSGDCTGSLSGYPKPAWQTGSGVPADGVRDLPDVSLFASNGVNYSFYPICADDGDCQQPSGSNVYQISGVGGTSASAPSFAGIMALVNQKYGRQGQADFVLYPLKAQVPAAFHDVTHGTIAVPCNTTSIYSEYGTFSPTDCIAVESPANVVDPTYGDAREGEIGNTRTKAAEYNAAAGYNLATGLGTIDANQLVTNWGNIKFVSTSTTLTASSTAFTHGSTIAVSGQVTSASGTPTGQVALMTDSTEAANQGQAYFTLSNGAYASNSTNAVNYLPGGTYNIWGQYGGDAKNGQSTSAKTQITVSPENSGVFLNVLEPSGSDVYTISSGTRNIAYGTLLSLSAIPAPSSKLSAYESCITGSSSSCPSFQLPTGTVTFKDGSTAVNTAVVNAEGYAEYTPPAAFSAGSHSITASYSGNGSYNASSASAITFSVAQAKPAVLIATPESSYPQGTSSSLTILVEGYGNGAAPTGTVTISGAPNGTATSATLSAGVDPTYGTTVGTATVAIPATAAAGNYIVSAAYTPDSASSGNYSSAFSRGMALQITRTSGIATTTTASVTSASTSPLAAITLSGTVKAASGAAPQGTVFLLAGLLNSKTSGATAGDYYIASTALTAATSTSSTFSFVLTSQSILRGANQLTVFYGGSSTDSPSSTIVNVSNPLSDFTLVPQATIVPVTAGASATDAINIASANGFSGAVSLSCTAAAGVTCSVSSPASLVSGGSVTATATIAAPASASSGSLNVLITASDSTGAHVHTLGIQAVVSTAAKTASPPAFSPAAGTFTSAQSVTISDATAGATIYYTTNGTTPTSSSTKYTGAVSVSATETLEAIAIATGYTNSAVATAKYTITPPAATPVFSPAAGTFTSTQSVSISDATTGAAIYYTTNGTTPTNSSTKYKGAISVSATETLEAIAVATGYTNSAVATAKYTITPPAATPTFSPAAGTFTSAQSVTISDATAGATIYYTTNGTTPTSSSTKYTGAISVSATKTLEAIAIATGTTNSAVVTAKYTITPPAATPAFSPAAGTFTSAQSVTISDATAGATIYYTTNGTTPTSSSTKYTGAISVSATETLEAIAIATGYTNSAVVTAKYTITPPAATPKFSPAAGTFSSKQSVTLSDATTGAAIYYTTNGTTPTTSSTRYTGAISVSATETLEAIAVAAGNGTSAVATAKYTIAAPIS